MITHDEPSLARVRLNDQGSLSRIQVFHKSGPYESYGALLATIRRIISIRVFLDGSQVWLKQLLHQNLKKSSKVLHRKSEKS